MMNKRNFALLICMALLLSTLSGCGLIDRLTGKDKTETSVAGSTVISVDESVEDEADTQESDENDTKDQQGETEEESASEPDYDSFYLPVMQNVCDYLLNPDLDYGLYEGVSGLFEVAIYSEAPLDEIYCKYEDINDDGIKELLVVDSGDAEYMVKQMIYSLFTISDGEVVNLLEGWPRNAYYYAGDGKFTTTQSGGAAYSGFGEFSFAPISNEIIWDDFYFSDLDDDLNSIFFHNKSGSWEINESEPYDAEDEEFWALYDTYSEKATEIDDLVSLSTYIKEGKLSMPIQITMLQGPEIPDDDFINCVLSDSDDPAVVALYTNEKIDNFQILGLSLASVNDDGEVFFNTDLIYCFDNFDPDHPILVSFTMMGDLADYGFSYDDGETTKIYAIMESGYDGSFYMERVNVERH